MKIINKLCPITQDGLTPAARRVVKHSASHNNTPKGSSRGSVKRLAFDVLVTSDEADALAAIDILRLVGKHVEGNYVKRKLADVKKLLHRYPFYPMLVLPKLRKCS